MVEGLEMICFKIISNVGGARSSYIEAIQKAKQGDFEGAGECIKTGQEMFLAGHEAHFELIQKESEYGDVDLSGLQKQHYRHYLDAIQGILLEQFGEVGIYTGPWTSGKITKGESNGSQCGTKGAA